MGVKPPAQPEDIFEPLLEDLNRALGKDLLGVSMFGSAAAGRYQKGKSDINLLLLLDDGVQKPASRLIFFYEKWRKAGLAPPLLVTRSYLHNSLDVFPIEFLTMAASHKCIYGQDALAGLEVKAEHVRLQLERELRGKLMALRTRVMSGLGRKTAVMSLINESLPAFTALFQALLHLTEGGFSVEPKKVLERLAQSGFVVESFLEMRRLREGEVDPKSVDLVKLIEGGILELETICVKVDELKFKESDI